ESVSFRFVATSGNSFLSDIAIDHIRVGSEVGENEPISCPPLDFNALSINSYGVNQDAGTYSISDGGNMLTIENNAWKSIEYSYEVTAETILELDFRSFAEGEIHGIGFDNDQNISAGQTFQFHGTQNWGILNYNTYTGTNWTTYTIPVGDFFTGNFSKLVFVCDNDGSGSDASMFRNVRLYESNECGAGLLLNDFGSAPPVYGTVSEKQKTEAFQLTVFPNPALERLNVRLSNAGFSEYQLLLMDITGKVHQSRKVTQQTETFGLDQLSSGIYLIQLRDGDEVIAVERFVKTR
ncbi:MAG TPA: T9SS type A sorting domain-containing protein, partial [Cryomorphaceae bacterium]|nr:T9SS type A sorting domain-containing protein [Cryomorphaceae bacterium]